MQDYKPNSHRFKEEQRTASVTPEPDKKDIKKVVTAPVKVKKKSPFATAIDSFVQEDLTNIKTYIISDVIIPTIKNTIWDAFTNSLDMILYGKTGHKRATTPGSSRASYVSYNKYSDNRNGRASEEPRRSRYDFGNISFTSKADADEVLRQMDAILDEYKIVTVVDLYDLVGITGEYTDSKYGWTNLRNATVGRGRDGYYLNLPKPLPID